MATLDTHIETAHAWLGGAQSTSNRKTMYAHDGKLWSYGDHYLVAERDGGTIWLVRYEDGPSATTRRHISAVEHALISAGFRKSQIYRVIQDEYYGDLTYFGWTR